MWGRIRTGSRAGARRSRFHLGGPRSSGVRTKRRRRFCAAVGTGGHDGRRDSDYAVTSNVDSNPRAGASVGAELAATRNRVERRPLLRPTPAEWLAVGAHVPPPPPPTPRSPSLP